jgi:hypothetical protein
MVVTRPMRSGKYRFTSGGSSTLPTPIAANVSVLAPTSQRASPATPRPNRPIESAPSATIRVASSPRRLAKSGVTMPNTA